MKKLTAAIYLSAVLAVFGLSAWACGCSADCSCDGAPEVPSGPSDDNRGDPLTAPVVVETIRFQDGKARWNAYAGPEGVANVYYVKINDADPIRTPLTYRSVRQGDVITVIACYEETRGEMQALCDGMWATARSFTYNGDNMLDQVNISIDAGVATWPAVDGATGYVYQIKAAGSEEWGAEQTTTERSVTLNVGDTIRVKATSSDEAMFDGEWTEETYTPTESSQLATPVVTINAAGRASWARVPNATGYICKINGVEQARQNPTFKVISAGDTIQVKAVGDGENFTDSAWSVVQKHMVVLATPVVEINTATGVASWASIEGATGYVVEINGVDMDAQEETEYQLEDGDEIRVKAVGDNSSYANGEYSEMRSYSALPTVNLSVPVLQLTNTTADGATVTWQAVPNAGGYKYQIKAAGATEWG